ncbi:alpha/beta hydrolase [Noviherbaspirillum galbum]|uniref:Alpha/beta hydrolase n=1 Tax=Noviherbaspirillum galbum TaxID=2709383 RepID=A0A6B3SS55_9BURK|nr:alpha/beta hydrolase [Noviherbaspirillum galbum]NEX63514.1 alpha/beta hydrolase [Noviherbaspirillum galbum]
MLHPQARALLDLMEQRGVPPTHTLPVEEARSFYRDRRFYTQPDPSSAVHTQDLTAEAEGRSIRMRCYKPASPDRVQANQRLPILVYFHGGGWVIGDLETHDVLCRELSLHAGCAVVAVDYRLAPEHRFPAAVDDCVVATRWIRDNAESLGVDPNRLAVGGDSAGGNLAAVVALSARDAGDLSITFQLLIYPATDMRRTAPSHERNGQGYLLTQDTIRYFHDHYITETDHNLDWRASPLLREDLSGLPPAFVLTAGYDPLCDEGTMYAQRLSEAGTRATLVCFERQIHGFITMGKVLHEANDAVRLCGDQLRAALASAG